MACHRYHATARRELMLAAQEVEPARSGRTEQMENLLLHAVVQRFCRCKSTKKMASEQAKNEENDKGLWGFEKHSVEYRLTLRGVSGFAPWSVGLHSTRRFFSRKCL